MTVLCRGQGLEPHVEVERNLVGFGPILPHSPGDEQTILLRNPCPFPVEIYNLECDKSYLEEEKVNLFLMVHIHCRVRTLILIPVLYRNREKGSECESVQCEHVLHSTM